MIRISLSAMLLCAAGAVAAQPFRAMRQADSLMAQGQYKAAIAAYQPLVRAHPNSVLVRHNLACAFALTKQPDSAFSHLDVLAAARMAGDMLTDADLAGLRRDKRWPALESRVVEAMQASEHFTMRDLSYARRLWEMAAQDQAYYGEILFAKQREGQLSAAAQQLWRKKDSLNKKNQRELLELIRTKGWPKYSQVGRAAGDAAFLVIQHADSALQRRFLPELLAYCKEKEASWESYALMYDRLQMARRLPQRYGTQIWSDPATGDRRLWTLEDPLSVEGWRKEAGLMPLREYVQMFGLTFPPADGQYQEITPGNR